MEEPCPGSAAPASSAGAVFTRATGTDSEHLRFSRIQTNVFLIWRSVNSYFYLFFFFFFLFFLGFTRGIWKFPGLGSNPSRRFRPAPPQRQLQATSATCRCAAATAMADLLTRYVGPGIKPASRRCRDAAEPVAPQWELPSLLETSWFPSSPGAGSGKGLL